jgi:hypothetical protein
MVFDPGADFVLSLIVIGVIIIGYAIFILIWKKIVKGWKQANHGNDDYYYEIKRDLKKH